MMLRRPGLTKTFTLPTPPELLRILTSLLEAGAVKSAQVQIDQLYSRPAILMKVPIQFKLLVVGEIVDL
jgi:hypothetical protein